ncbi:F-box/kelch-repeat protein [Trifolium medium]|uniref:F-box/kelch-repeat protein n=1 Tax=Trifolium medium TaxID=97028 RepID=A0A392MYS7_9FABA|nr:F-box/kelch-repeat protein [Trifolium medium]
MTKYRSNFLSNTPSYEGDTTHVLMDIGYELYSLSGDSSNGILCLSYDNYCDNDGRIVLWNPTTEKFKVIPPTPKVVFGVIVTLCGFGYDHIADDYKPKK